MHSQHACQDGKSPANQPLTASVGIGELLVAVLVHMLGVWSSFLTLLALPVLAALTVVIVLLTIYHYGALQQQSKLAALKAAARTLWWCVLELDARIMHHTRRLRDAFARSDIRSMTETIMRKLAALQHDAELLVRNVDNEYSNERRAALLTYLDQNATEIELAVMMLRRVLTQAGERAAVSTTTCAAAPEPVPDTDTATASETPGAPSAPLLQASVSAPATTLTATATATETVVATAAPAPKAPINSTAAPRAPFGIPDDVVVYKTLYSDAPSQAMTYYTRQLQTIQPLPIQCPCTHCEMVKSRAPSS